MKKLIIGILVVIFTVSLIFMGVGCKKEEAPAEEAPAEEAAAEEVTPAEEAPAEEAPAEAKEIRLMIADTPEETPSLYAQTQEYEAETGNKIVWVTIAPDPGEISSSLVPAFESGTTPGDVLMVPFLGLLRGFAEQDYLTNMSELGATIDGDWGWAPGMLETGTLPGTDNVYALPQTAYVNSIGLYRISFFADNGIEVQNTITWDDFLNLCAELKDLTGSPTISMASVYGTRLLTEHLICAFAGKDAWNDFTLGKIKASDPAIKEALEKLATLRDEGYVTDPMKEPEMVWGWWDGDNPIGLRQPGMVGVLGPDVSREDAYKDQGYFVISGKDGLPDAYCGALTFSSIPKYSPVIPEAEDFLEWLTAPDKFAERAEAGDIPVINIGIEDLHPETARILDVLGAAEFRFDISDMVGGEWAFTLDQQVELLLINGTDYVDQAIETIDGVANPLSQS